MSLEARLHRWGAWYNHQLGGMGLPKKNLRGGGVFCVGANEPPAFDEIDIERIDSAYNELMCQNISLGLCLAHHYRDGLPVSKKKINEAKRAIDRLLT